MKNAATAKVVYRIVSGRDDEQAAAGLLRCKRGQTDIECHQLALVFHCSHEEDGIRYLSMAGKAAPDLRWQLRERAVERQIGVMWVGFQFAQDTNCLIGRDSSLHDSRIARDSHKSSFRNSAGGPTVTFDLCEPCVC